MKERKNFIIKNDPVANKKRDQGKQDFEVA